MLSSFISIPILNIGQPDKLAHVRFLGRLLGKSKRKQKTQTIREDHLGFRYSETSGEPAISKFNQYMRPYLLDQGDLILAFHILGRAGRMCLSMY